VHLKVLPLGQEWGNDSSDSNPLTSLGGGDS